MVKRPLWDMVPWSSDAWFATCFTRVFSFFFFPPLQLPQLWKSSEVMESWGCASSQSWPDGSQNLSWVLTLFLAFCAKMEEKLSLVQERPLQEKDTVALNKLFCLVNGATTPSGTLFFGPLSPPRSAEPRGRVWLPPVAPQV